MKVFVFDLDFTLWDAGGTWCDATNPPYRWNDGYLLDSRGARISLYPDVVPILEHLNTNGKVVAVASRTYEPAWAQHLLHLFDIDRFFHMKEIYPASKVQHFERIHRHFKIPYTEMVFFDDEHRNITEVGKLGVRCVLVENGLTIRHVAEFLGKHPFGNF